MNNTTQDFPIRPDLLRALMVHAEHGITIAEREGSDTILLYVNRAFEELAGYSMYHIGVQKDVTKRVNLQQELEKAQARIAELEAR